MSERVPARPRTKERFRPARPAAGDETSDDGAGTEERGVISEARHVHHVYDVIASDFSCTRYRAWPVVERFLAALPSGAVVADIGCGNGKNMRVRSDIVCIGLERSPALAAECALASLECFVGDNQHIPLRSVCCDAVLSIAVIHHFSTRERRIRALSELLRLLRPGGRALVFVWAREQHRFEGAPTDGDIFVPWHLRADRGGRREGADEAEMPVFWRYYHLFAKGELEELVSAVGVGVRFLESGFDSDNWFCVVERAS